MLAKTLCILGDYRMRMLRLHQSGFIALTACRRRRACSARGHPWIGDQAITLANVRFEGLSLLLTHMAGQVCSYSSPIEALA